MERGAVAALVMLTLGLRLLYVQHYRIDSDEPQHQHVAWAWTQGMLQYRDVFDNHAPLFHLLVAPIVARLGERVDILVMMRLAMLPLYVATVLAAAAIAHALFSTRVAWWTSALAALAPAFFLTSVEFRTDDLWAATFLTALAVVVRGRLTPARSLAAGFLLGAAFGISMKSSMLLVAIAIAAVCASVGHTPKPSGRRFAVCGGAWLAGMIVVPAALIAFFAVHGALSPFLYGTIWHNVLPGLGFWHKPAGRPLLLPGSLPLLALGARRLALDAPTRACASRRIFVFLVAGIYVTLLLGLWPLLTAEDWLPVAPLVPLAGASAVDFLRRITASRGGFPTPLVRTLAISVLAGELALTLWVASPWTDNTQPQRNLLATVLQLTDPGEYIMDAKGESVFRPRAYYWVLEHITKERLQRGLIRDDVPERLIATRTTVVMPDCGSFPARARAFMLANYLPVGNVRVLGRWIRLPTTSSVPREVEFEVVIPQRYAVVETGREVVGTLDGRPYDGPRYLTEGRHHFRADTTDTGALALVWDRAIERGFMPSGPWKGSS